MCLGLRRVIASNTFSEEDGECQVGVVPGLSFPRLRCGWPSSANVSPRPRGIGKTGFGVGRLIVLGNIQK